MPAFLITPLIGLGIWLTEMLLNWLFNKKPITDEVNREIHLRNAPLTKAALDFKLRAAKSGGGSRLSDAGGKLGL